MGATLLLRPAPRFYSGLYTFGGPLWQLWVNHTLVHAEAEIRGAAEATFAVCAPAANVELTQKGQLIDEFRSLLTAPSSFVFIPLEELIGQLAAGAGAARHEWISYLQRRYVVNPAEPRQCG
jgi:hypothetical protein